MRKNWFSTKKNKIVYNPHPPPPFFLTPIIFLMLEIALNQQKTLNIFVQYLKNAYNIPSI